MSPSTNVPQGGWTLPVTSFALAVMLSIMRLLSFESRDVLHIASEIRRSDRLHKTISATVRDSPPSSSLCEELPISYEETSLLYEVCREGFRPWSTTPSSWSLPQARLDYDALFSRASECQSPPKPTTFVGGVSPFAARDCHLPNEFGGSLILLDNIIGEALAFQRIETEELILATPGRVMISKELSLSHDLVIVAGGDVRIATLRAISPVKVSIFSSLGEVSVGAVEGDASLFIAARGATEVPQTSPSLDYPLPPLRAPTLYSMRPLR